MRTTQTEEARAILNNPGHRPAQTAHDVSDLLQFMPHTIPQTIIGNDYALKVWYDTLPSLIEKGIVHANDLDGFIIYCTSIGNYHRAAEQLANEEFMLTQVSREGYERVVQNPLLSVMKMMETVALRWGKEFGLTPLSRGNVKATRSSSKSKLSEFTQQ